MNQEIELLAPCGTYEAFLAAIENGANAVYLGGKLFNARANASNFDLEELEKMVKYAHLRGVKIHVTLNTLLTNEELSEALSFAYDLYNIGIDAVIVQDLGLAKILHEYLPNLELHASTQMTIHNLEGVNELKKLGFKRVVLARELSLEEIKYICDHTDLDIEIFVHGALCISYSGQCLMSSMIGDRSGNRGKCAQPCRLPYTLLKNDEEMGKGYLLSPKDLSMLEILPSLPNVKSLKIEGRMKQPEYVAMAVQTYRKYLDKLQANTPIEIEKEDQTNLAQIFNRGGFTTAYLEKKQGASMMSYERPKNWGIYIGNVLSYDGKRYITVSNGQQIHIGDGIEIISEGNIFPSTIVSEIEGEKIGRIHGNIHVGDKVYKTSDKELMKKMRESYSRNSTRKTAISMKVEILKNQKITVFMNHLCYQTEIIPEEAKNNPLTQNDIEKQFLKTGETPFEISNLEINLEDGLFLPISKLNEIRRNALNYLEENFLSTREKLEKQTLPPMNMHPVKTPHEVSLFVYHLTKDIAFFQNVSSLYVPFKEVLTKEEIFTSMPFQKYIVLPTITKGNYAKLIMQNITHLATICDGFVLSNIGQLAYVRNLSSKLIANYTFNVFNDHTIRLLEELGFQKIILSPELTKEQISSLSSDIDLEYIVYGKQVVMTSEHCPVGSIIGGFTKNAICKKPCLKNDFFYLKDRLGMKFQVLPDNIDCQSQIFNSKITSIESHDLNIDSIRIDILNEDINDIQTIIDTHLQGKKLSGECYTNGHINRPV